MNKEQTNLRYLDLETIQSQGLLPHLDHKDACRPSIPLPLQGLDFIQLIRQPLRRQRHGEKSGKVIVEGEHWPNVRITQAQKGEHPRCSINPPPFSLRFPASRHIIEHPYMLYGAAVGQPAAMANLPSEQGEAFRQHNLTLQTNVSQLQERLIADKAINTTLEQSLAESREALEQAQAEHQERERELRTCLDETNIQADQTAQALRSEIDQLRQSQASLEQTLRENQARLAQTEAEHRQRESQLQAALSEANRSASDSLARSESKISALEQQIQTQEATRQQLLQEKTELANCLQTEATRALEFAQQTQSLDERIQNREREFEAIQQEGNDAIATLRGELEQARRAIEASELSHQQLVESLQQSQIESQAQQARLNQTLAGERAQAREEQSRLGALIEDLKAQLQTDHAEADEKQLALLTQLKQEQHAAENLQRLLKNAEEREAITKESLAEAKRSADESLRRNAAEVATLQQQIQTQEFARQQMLQEKRVLANCLQTETNHALEFTQRVQSLDERRQHLESALEAMQQAGNEAEAQHLDTIASLREELERAQLSNDELSQTNQQQSDLLNQVQSKSQAQQEHLQQALQAEKQQASEEQSRVAAVIEELNGQLETTRAKAIHHRKKWIKLAVLVKQKHLRGIHLKHLLKSANEAVEITKQRLAEAELKEQALRAELQQELKAGHEAWQKASESDIAMQVTKQELASLKVELEQEITNLRAQLEHQQEYSDAALSRHITENEKLQESLAQNQLALQAAGNTIRSLKSDQQTQRKAQLAFEAQFAQQEEKLRAKQAKLTAAVESGQQEIASLRQQLDAANALIREPETQDDLSPALQQAKEEIASLKQKIKGLHEVQREMERQLNQGHDAEVQKLRSALEEAEAKLKAAEQQAPRREGW